jgi:hypothetical protein
MILKLRFKQSQAMTKYLIYFLLFLQLGSLAQAPLILTDTFIDGKHLFGYKQNNRLVIKPEYSEANVFVENIALVKKDGHYKYINTKGEDIGKQHFVDARSFSEGLAEVKLSSGWGFVNNDLKIVIDGQYENSFPFSEGISAVKKTKWQFINKNNELAIQILLDTVVSNFTNGLAIVGYHAEEFKYGVITKNGTWLLPCIQKEIKRLNPNLFLAKAENNFYQLYDSKGKVLIDQIESVSKILDTLYIFEKQGYQNLFNAKGKISNKNGFKAYEKGIIIPFPKWKLNDTTFKTFANIEADSFKLAGKHLVRYLNGKQQIVYPKTIGGFYQDIQQLDAAIFSVKKDNKWAMMNELGETITPFGYDSIRNEHPYYKIWEDEKSNLVNKKGNEILNKAYSNFTFHPKTNHLLFDLKYWVGIYNWENATITHTSLFDTLSELSKTILLGRHGESVYLLDEELNRLDSMSFHEVRLIADTLLLAIGKDSVYRRSMNADSIFVRKMDARFFLNDTLVLVKASDTTMGVYHFLSDSIYTFEADTAWRHPNMPNRILTKKKDTLGLAHIEGRLLANYPRHLSFIGNEEDGYVKVISKRHYGIIDTNGRLLIATQYDSVQKVKEGLAAVKLRGKWGFVDLKEKILVQPYYQKVGAFTNKKAPVWLAGLATLVDNTGRELFKPKFQNIEPSKNGNWVTTQNNVFGFLYPDSQEAFNPKFEKVSATKSGFYIVSLYGKMGILNTKLQIVKPFVEKEIRGIVGTDYFMIKE